MKSLTRTLLLLALGALAMWYFQRRDHDPVADYSANPPPVAAPGAPLGQGSPGSPGSPGGPGSSPSPASPAAPADLGSPHSRPARLPATTGPIKGAREIEPRGDLTLAERAVVDLFEQGKRSVAYIFTETVSGRSLTREVAQGAGSGFVWDTAGHVVTNAHVVNGAKRIQVQLDLDDSGDAKPLDATLVGIAPHYDLAVVILKSPPANPRPIPIGRSGDLKVGQTVYAIGNPFGLTKTLTTGIVSALDRRLPIESGREIVGAIQTDASINPGNSGGPLLDSAGRLIGVNTAIVSESGSSAGVGFAIPVDLVNRIVPQLIDKGRVPRPGIGINAADERLNAALGINGVIVTGVGPGTPAAGAGLQALDLRERRLGDVIVSVDGRPIRTVPELTQALEAAGIGNSVRLGLYNGERTREASVRVVDLGD